MQISSFLQEIMNTQVSFEKKNYLTAFKKSSHPARRIKCQFIITNKVPDSVTLVEGNFKHG